MNRLDIPIAIIQTVQNFVKFPPLKSELLLKQSYSSGAHSVCSVRKVCVCGLLGKKWLAELGSLENKQIS